MSRFNRNVSKVVSIRDPRPINPDTCDHPSISFWSRPCHLGDLHQCDICGKVLPEVIGVFPRGRNYVYKGSREYPLQQKVKYLWQ